MKLVRRRSRFGRRAARTLAASGVAFGAVAIIGNWGGVGWVSGPAAIGALGLLLLAFVVANLPAATDNRVTEEDATLPFRVGGADPD